MKISLSLKLWIFPLLTLVSAPALAQNISDDINNPRYGLPIYPKEELQAELAKLPSPARKAIQAAVPKGTLERLKFVEGTLHGSQVFLAQLIKVREGEDSDGAVGDNFVYLLVEMAKDKARVWKLYDVNYPVETFFVPVFGFVEDPSLQACHLDFYVNQDTDNCTAGKDFFQFVPGKKVHVVLTALDCKYNPEENPNPDPAKQFFHETKSNLFSKKDGRLRVETLSEEGYASRNPDPAKPAAESTKTIIRIKADFRWMESNQKYEPLGTPVTQRGP